MISIHLVNYSKYAPPYILVKISHNLSFCNQYIHLMLNEYHDYVYSYVK